MQHSFHNIENTNSNFKSFLCGNQIIYFFHERVFNQIINKKFQINIYLQAYFTEYLINLDKIRQSNFTIVLKLYQPKFFFMNLSERAEDIDYEPDVLKFKQIWNEMKVNTKEKPKETQKLPPPQRGESKNKKKEKKPLEYGRKETVVSKKNIQSNSKTNPEKVIEIVTQPQGFYADNVKNQKNMSNPETLLQTNPNNIYPVGEVHQLKHELSEKDYELSLLRVTNSRNQERVQQLENQINQKEERILQLQGRQRELLTQIAFLNGKQMVFDYGKVQYENFKNDTRRLLKMLQTTSEYQQFASLALDDNCVRFLHTVNQKKKTQIDNHSKAVLHFCTCNKEFIPESGFWIPEKVYSFGREFIKDRKGQMTLPELELLLYQLNKLWRERQKRIINTINSQKAKELGVLKRKLRNIYHEKNKKGD